MKIQILFPLSLFSISLLLGLGSCKKDKFAKADHNGIYLGRVLQFDLSDSSFVELSDSFSLELSKISAFKYELVSSDENILPSMIFKSQGATREGVVLAEKPDDEAWYMLINYIQAPTSLVVGHIDEFEGTSYTDLVFEGLRK